MREILTSAEASASLSVLPANASWTLQCGVLGMSIVFGNVVRGDQESVRNDVIVDLSIGQIDQNNCAILGPRIGKRLQAILKQDQHTQ
jgi:hypothetical protein